MQSAVHILRNTIIVSGFLGGTAVTGALNTLSGMYAESLLTLSLIDVRKTLLASLLFLAFLNMAIVARSCSHVGYLLGISAGK